ncbi:BTAD domain-containing putative transcriptional regulator [Nocardioides daeguensis]|uniref:BTAD domain-containing putative transcriptional regulator n=1 Tax=Nocardioides daeguensis TaxID=908359 RepID=UPI001C4665B1|nr:BTAD domain-containing putative transcriptional regulator [Nocardioides daeguensis]MBV6729404.1 response regulator [Nocardioides daeguensis]MCR1771823.1 response regulator [Nocardioides daeguensis]
MRMRVLGPVEVEVDGSVLDLGAPKPRQVLAVLALHRGQPVSPETIAGALWGDQPPASHAVTIQGYVSSLRKALEPERAPRRAGTVIQTSALGYALRLPVDEIDAARLEMAVRSAGVVARTDRDRPWLIAGSPDPDQLGAAADLLDEAVAAWRGEPYADLADDPVIAVERRRLHEVRTAAVELRELIRMQRGDAAAAARRLETEVTGQPHRERLWLLYAAALVLAERQVDALAALRRLRDTLRDDLGVDASPAVGALETAILQQRVAAEPSARATTVLRVAVVDDHPMFRMGMTGLLGSLEGLELVGAAGESAGARALVARGVDVVLMDLDLAGESGIDLTRELVRDHPALKVLVMTMHEDDDHVAGALQAGAAGYLLKSAEADDVLRAIRGVARGELIIGSAVASAARSRLARP